MTKVALRIFSIKLLKITYQIAKLINGKNPRAKTEERKMANTSVIVIPEGKICDYVDGKFRNDTPEEYVRQTICFVAVLPMVIYHQMSRQMKYINMPMKCCAHR